jgi:hypothetical protein
MPLPPKPEKAVFGILIDGTPRGIGFSSLKEADPARAGSRRHHLLPTDQSTERLKAPHSKYESTRAINYRAVPCGPKFLAKRRTFPPRRTSASQPLVKRPVAIPVAIASREELSNVQFCSLMGQGAATRVLSGCFFYDGC